ncbi:MAG TPA: antibiotic biosynthesis monooxygenase [Methanobacterium sp.]
MVYVLGKLKVENYENWKTFFDKRSDTRKESGAKEAHLFRNSDDPNEVLILFIWDTKENAQKYMESDNLRKYLKNAGSEIKNVTYLDEQETSI